MSSISSWTSSFAEQTIFAIEDDFVHASDTTGRTSAPNAFSYDPTSAYDLHQTNAANVGADLDIQVNHVRIEERADLFSELSDDTYSLTNRDNDKDWPILFPSAEALPSFSASDFIIDADACINPRVVSELAPTNNTILAEDMLIDDSLYDYTEHTDFADIEEVFHSFDAHSQIGSPFEQSLHQETRLQEWQYDYQRHEWVALKFELPPYTTERQ
ncbi:hypothetical protein VTL71DRAFT_3205 [Oculimacula yallundae]|uniref:Uncharacterized protein n=1 Tax=Oculimacula yallundae TaxID=86028 RepID=A0ABR4C6G1_9HELO